MRKNTLIKLLAVLVMCLTIGAAFVACSEEPADTSANNDVKVIVSVAVDANNNLVITYNDNTTSTVALPKEAECEHREDRQAWWPLAEHTATANGTYLKVCHDCQDAWIIYDSRHQIVEKEITVPATCTEAGYVTNKYCEICGYTENVIEELPALGHDLGELIVIANDDESICVSGGTHLKECSRCDYVWSETVEAAEDKGIDGQHTVTVWETVVAPTVDAAGSAAGYCDVCDAYVEVELPALNTTDYNREITDKVLHCGDEGKYTYTHKETGLKYDVIRPAHDHGLVGLDGKHHELKSAVVDNPAASEWYSTADFPQIKEFVEDSINSCTTPVLAYYVCEHINDDGVPCGGVVDIYAITGHEFTVELTDKYEAPKCGVDGKKWFKCYACDKEDFETVPALEHNFVYNCDEYTDLTVAADEKSATYVGYCANGCGATDTKTTTSLTIETVDKTCEKNGVKKYAWVDHNGNEHTDEEIIDGFIGHAVLVGNKVVALQKANEKDLENLTQEELDKKVYYYADFVDAEGKPLLFNFVDDQFGAEPTIGYFVCCHTELHDSEPLVKVWVSTDAKYAVNTPDELK